MIKFGYFFGNAVTEIKPVGLMCALRFIVALIGIALKELAVDSLILNSEGDVVQITGFSGHQSLEHSVIAATNSLSPV